jgi:hypothetical protein
MGIATFDEGEYGEEGEIEQDSDEYDDEQAGEKKAKQDDGSD